MVFIATACEDGWVEGASNSCYKFVMDKRASWSDAQAACEVEGGELAQLETLHEIYWMRGYRSWHDTLRRTAWIGGLLDDGVWKWQYGKETAPIEHFDWAGKGPDNIGSRGSKAVECISLYGKMGGSDSAYRFDDDGCNIQHGYICEK